MTERALFDQMTNRRRLYQEEIRPFLTDVTPDRVKPLDDLFARLESFPKRLNAEAPVCFLGASGVGKSTLINALVGSDKIILPAGGVGPLTAQATVVRFSEKPYLKARYLPREKLNKILFALERAYERDLRSKGADCPTGGLNVAPDVEAAVLKDVELGIFTDPQDHPPPNESSGNGRPDSLPPPDVGATQVRDTLAAYTRMAQIVVRGNQFTEDLSTPYLLDALRFCIGSEPRWGQTLLANDRDRLERVRAVLNLLQTGTDEVEIYEQDDPVRFRSELAIHASGFLSPLLKTLELGWNNPILKDGLVFVDLPGVGVANDETRKVTSDWIRRARAIVLVVDRAGVTEASASLLRQTGFINNLLHDTYDEQPEPITLLVAVVKLDLVATDERAKAKQIDPEEKRRWVDFFDRICEQVVPVIRGQVGQELEKFIQQSSDAARDDMRDAIDRIVSGLLVHPVSAIEYRKFLLNDDDDKPRIRSLEDSRIPQLSQNLQKIAHLRRQRIYSRGSALLQETDERLKTSLRTVIAQWESDARAEQLADELRAELEAFAQSKRNELNRRNGEFREFLYTSISEKIDVLTDLAAADAEREIRQYLQRFRRKHGHHWSTLRAAIRRGGAYVGATHIDIPHELSLRFEEQIAVVWSKEILRDMRRRTRQLGADYVRLVGDIVDWARQQGGRVSSKVVEAMHDELKAETKNLGQVGRDAIADLKEQVRSDLIDKVEKRVRHACERFVKRGLDRGTGVKVRMLEMLDDLAPDVATVAKKAAKDVLKRHYEEARQQIIEEFQRFPNPVDSAVRALVDDHERYIRRSDAQRRRNVLARANDLLRQIP